MPTRTKWREGIPGTYYVHVIHVLIKSGLISVVQMGLPSKQDDTKQTENAPSSKQTTAETLVRTANMSDILVKNQVNNHVCYSERSLG